MKQDYNIYRIVKAVLMSCLITAALALPIVVGISYYALKKLAFATTDRVIFGKSQALVVNEIRNELLKRSDISQVSFTSTDNIKLSGLLIKRAHARANVLLCHGYKSTKELHYGYIDLFPESNIFLFDFRAHGQSEGSMTTIGCHEWKDIIAATTLLRKQTDATLPFIILGISMGGAASIKAVEQKPDLCDALIIDSSYASLSATTLKSFSARSGLPHYPFFPLIKFMFHYFAQCDMHDMNPVESVKYIKLPILFIHSSGDTYTSPKNSHKLFAQAQNKQSRLWIGPPCRHGYLYTYHESLYTKQVTTFLNETIPPLSR